MFCPVCSSAQVEPVQGNGDYKVVECVKCGRYEITGSAYVSEVPSGKRSLVSCWVRSEYERGAVVRVDNNLIDDIEQLAPSYTVVQKLELVLGRVAVRSRFGGDNVSFEYDDGPAVWVTEPRELDFLFQTLEKAGLVEIRRPGAGRALALTAEGWGHFLNGPSAGQLSDLAFVAMSFSPAMKPVYENAIAKAVQSSGYRPHRLDYVLHADRIDQKILRDIDASRFVLADVTEQRNGVYFEAGYAIGVGKKVIWSVQKDELAKVHFDTRQFAHLVWESEDDLRRQLEGMIAGIIGTGPHRRGT